MHSLKELRAENAAKRLSDSRTAGANEIGPSPTAAAAAAATTAPRVARTLAPLTSTGSLLPATTTPAEPAAVDDGQQQADREARRRRRLRRRREREQRENEDEDNSKINADDNATAASGTSQASTTPREEDGKGARTAAGAVFGEKGGVLSDRTSAPANKQTFDGEKTTAVMTNDGIEKPQLSARGEPPPEKPKKKLTPLEARRARIEQQKREEIERSAKVSNQSPRSAGLERPQETPGTKSDARSEGEAVVDDGHRSSDRRKPNSAINADSQRRTKRNIGGEGDAARISEEEKYDSGTEHDPLIAAGRSAEGKSEDDDYNNGRAARSNSEDTQEEQSTPPAETPQKVDDGGETNEALLASTDGGLLEDAAVGDGGRFQGMRSRMKKAGKGFLPKKTSGSSARRRKGTDDAAPGEVVGKDKKQPEPVEGTNAGGTLPGDGGESTAREAGGEDGDGSGGGQKPSERPGDESDTASNDSALSPVLSEAEKDASFETDGSDEGGKGRKNKWRRTKDKGSADAPLAGGKEVTLGHVVDRKMREMGYIRKPAVDELKSRRSLRDRVAAEGAPEVHFIGEISGAEGFGSGISCRFRIEGGRHWTCLAGLEEGQTHVMHTDYGEAFAPWNHPIDLHYTTKSIQGWPRLMVQVWQLDTHGRNVLRGYGFRHLPSNPGFSEVSVPCWRPSGTMQEETAAFFLGVTPRLTAEDAVFNRAWDQRCRLVTLPAGTVWVQMNGLFCNLQDQGVDAL